MTKTEFSNFDVFAITKELDALLVNTTIVNIYEIEDMLILKINTSSGKKNLIIKSDSRINLTEYDYPLPKYPSQYIMSLRKLLKNRHIFRVYQYDFDRIVVIELSNPEGESWLFIIELFNKGNFLLLKEKNLIKVAKTYKKFKDRDVLANKEYVFPQSRGKNFLNINFEEFRTMLENSDVEVVKIIARNINISGTYSEEICYRAGVDKNLIGKNLIENDLKRLFDSFKDLRNQLLFGTYSAHIVLDNEGSEIFASPFEIELFKDYKKRFFPTFNDAVDEFYSKIDEEDLKAPDDQKINAKIKSQEKILSDQFEYLEELKKKKEKYYKIGDYIYKNFNSLEKLVDVIKNARAKGYKWEEINEKLQNAKKENLEGTDLFNHIAPETKMLAIKINSIEVGLDLNKSLGENANYIYSKGKKIDKKMKGTLVAIENTKLKLDELNKKKELLLEGKTLLIKKPKRKWFEKFRWFLSSDDFLVIGGRDASSNELIYKKHLEQNDMVLHTDFPGSPLTVIKNPENKEIPENTIKETADFVATFSRAWKEVWGVVDVFYVLPEQVSKSPPTGEYLPKGSFMIYGKKNFIKNAKTELAFGLNFISIVSNSEDKKKDLYPQLICGPISAIKAHAHGKIIVISPSKTGLTKGKLAKEIKSFYVKNSDTDLIKWVKYLPLDEIVLNLPNGNSEIKTID